MIPSLQNDQEKTILTCTPVSWHELFGKSLFEQDSYVVAMKGPPFDGTKQQKYYQNSDLETN